MVVVQSSKLNEGDVSMTMTDVASTTSPVPTLVSTGTLVSSHQKAPSMPLESCRQVTKEPLVASVSSLVKILANAKSPSGVQEATALRELFALSEHTENCIEMVHVADGSLVPVLLDFVQRCEKGSNEQSLTLLILNNICIPTENKRLIALTHAAAKILCRLLCKDPSCHLIVIILVNLTFADAELRSDLIAPEADIQLVESLSFSLRVASLTPEEYQHRLPLLYNDPEKHKTPSELLMLANHLVEDQLERTPARTSVMLPPSQKAFPDTVRWSLSAIKNLTRPSADAAAANALINAGIVPHIFHFVTVASTSRDTSTSDSPSRDSCSSSKEGTPVPSEPTDSCEVFTNSPATWDTQSPQDTALFIIMNLAAVPSAREYIREIDALHILSMITISELKEATYDSMAEEELLEFQHLKARMALSYLLGSEGYFGQPPARSLPRSVSITASFFEERDDSTMVVRESEVTRLVELLANTLHERPKEGASGYSKTTFSLKYVLLALRCLLTQHENQIRFANAQGTQVNSLLMKVLALHCFDDVACIDAEAAEYACFSLYLLSNFSFQPEQVAFLPAGFASEEITESLATKVLTSYHLQENVTPAGKHAVDQLLLRQKYLIFDGTPSELAITSGSSTKASDFCFEESLVQAAEQIFVHPREPGACPDPGIFNRTILRRRAMMTEEQNERLIWDSNAAAVDRFPNALQAVQDLSFGSTKVRHLDAIDDVQIANNIVHNANGEKGFESYNFAWNWEEHKMVKEKTEESSNSFLSFIWSTSSTTDDGKKESFALGIFDSLCGMTTTKSSS